MPCLHSKNSVLMLDWHHDDRNLHRPEKLVVTNNALAEVSPGGVSKFSHQQLRVDVKVQQALLRHADVRAVRHREGSRDNPHSSCPGCQRRSPAGSPLLQGKIAQVSAIRDQGTEIKNRKIHT